MNIGDFTAKARLLASFNPATIADDAARNGVAYGDLLAQVADDFDSALKTSATLQQRLSDRAEIISSTRKPLSGSAREGSPALRAVDISLLPEELALTGEGGADDLALAIETLQSKAHPFDAEADAAMDGALILDKSAPDAIVDAFKQSSSFWADGLIAKQEATMEHALRSDAVVNADAASLLGQPIVTLNIPTPGSSRKASVQWGSHRATPDRIISPPSGFSALDDAKQAAINYVGAEPGVSVVGVRDSRDSIHLLAAQVDSTPRVFSRGRKLRAAKQTSHEVAVESNHPRVEFVTRSDGSVAEGSKALPKNPWPGGHTQPLTPEDLVSRGLAFRHQSVESRLKLAESQTKAARASLTEHTKQIKEARLQLRDQLRAEEELKVAIDKPGTADARSWEITPMLQWPKSDRTLMINLTDQFGGFTRSLPEMTVSEAIQQALRTRPLQIDHSLTLVLQDSKGVPHLASTEHFPLRETLTFSHPHPDIRAIVDHSTGELWLSTIKGGKTALNQTPAFVGSSAPLNTDTLFRKLFSGNGTPLDNDRRIFKRFADGEPIRLLDATEPPEAAAAAAELVKGLKGRQSKLLVVNVSQGDEPARFGAVRISGTNDDWWSRDDRSMDAHSRLIALVDGEGIGWIRE